MTLKRNSDTIFIQSENNTITPVAWINNKPDFTRFTDPTLSILQSIYEFNRDNIEIIPNLISQIIIPREIDARRLRLALLQLDYLDRVETAISTLGRAAQIEWEFATIIKEDYSLVIALKDSLALNTDEIFTLANSLN